MKTIIVVCWALFVSVYCVQAQQMLNKIEIKEHVENAQLIVEAKVIEKKSYKEENTDLIYTVNKISILNNFSNLDDSKFLYLITKGGSLGYDTQKVVPSLQLNIGNVGVFFLTNSDKKLEGFSSKVHLYRAYSDKQGFYEYDLYKNTVSNPFYHYKSIEDEFYKTLSTLMNKPFKKTVLSIVKSPKILSSLLIDSFEPKVVRAGIGESLTIIGSGFGNEIGSIDFEDANEGGGPNFGRVSRSHILNWSDSSIEVIVPDFAGSGKIRVLDENGVNQFESNESVTILSSETNATFDTNEDSVPDTDFRVKLIGDDREGGYTWIFNEQFSENLNAVNAFKSSIKEWVCVTGINWNIAEATSAVNSIINDDINVVHFAPSGSEIGRGTLAVTTSYFSGCKSEEGPIVAFLSEVDMTFNSDVNWNFEESEPSNSQIDFRGTVTHELGHAHNMGHVISLGNLMHFDTFSGLSSATRTIDINTEEGAKANLEFSRSGMSCTGLRDNSEKSCNDDELANRGLNLIQNENSLEVLFSKFERLSIFDIAGRLLVFQETNKFATSILSNGIYIITVTATDGNVAHKKFIVNRG